MAGDGLPSGKDLLDAQRRRSVAGPNARVAHVDLTGDERCDADSAGRPTLAVRPES